MKLLDWLWPPLLRPGMKCPKSGQYTWSRFPHDQATCVKGIPMPPLPMANRDDDDGYWRLTDVTITDHRRG